MFQGLNPPPPSVAALALFLLFGPVGSAGQAARPVAVIDAAKTG